MASALIGFVTAGRHADSERSLSSSATRGYGPAHKRPFSTTVRAAVDYRILRTLLMSKPAS